MTSDPILDDVFQWFAWRAFIDEARAAQGWPDPEKTKQRCYAMYEAELESQSAGDRSRVRAARS